MRMKKILAALAIAVLPSIAFAQSNPGLTYHQVPTAGQWNSYFSAKQDTLGFTPLNIAGGTISGRLVTAAPGATVAGFNLSPGTSPGSPANGDLWTTSVGLYVQINGTTVGPLAAATSGSFAATSPLSVSFPAGVVTYACATCGVTSSPLSQFAATTSAQLLGVISDESGSGLAVFNNTPTLITPILGVATATSINKVAITAPATSATLTIANGKTLTANSSLTLAGVDAKTLTVNNSLTLAGVDAKTLTVNNSLTFAGTDSTVMTFPGTSDTVVTLTASQTLTNKTLSAPIVTGSFTATGLVGYAALSSGAVASCAQYSAATASTLAASANVFCAETTTTFGATTTFDFSTFINTVVTLTGNITTQTLSNVKAGQAGTITFVQDGTGSRTSVWNAIFKFASGVTPSLSTTASAIDVLSYSCRSATVCVASLIKDVR